MLSEPTLIVISGAPGSGKTTLAKTLGNRYGLITFHKDGFKEVLFDSLGWSDREWSKKVGAASFQVLYHAVESLLQANHSCVLESNFIAKYDAPRFLTFRETFNARVLEVLCICDPAITFQRFQQRVLETQRHPGHVEHTNLEDFEQMIRNWKTEPINPSHPTFSIDTSQDFDEQYAKLFAELDPLLS